MSLEDQLSASTPEEPKKEEQVAVTEPTSNGEPDFPEPEPLPEKSEYEVLVERATQMGLKFRSNIGLDKLRALVTNALEGNDTSEEDEEAEEEVAVPSSIPSPSQLLGNTAGPQTTTSALPFRKETKAEKFRRVRQEARQLVRVRITCHNPNKSEWQGEIITFGNAAVGTLKRYVPFETEWHVERAILNVLKKRQYQHFYNAKDEKGNVYRASKLVREFAVEELAQLTEAELKELAQRQAMANGA